MAEITDWIPIIPTMQSLYNYNIILFIFVIILFIYFSLNLFIALSVCRSFSQNPDKDFLLDLLYGLPREIILMYECRQADKEYNKTHPK